MIDWTPRARAPTGPVAYDSTNWCQIMFQCMGSTWPKVLPFCIANVLLMILLTKIQSKDVNWGISGQGHGFASMIVSFLVVSRINTALSRYYECRQYIASTYRESRELVQNMMVFSRRNKNTSQSSREWRSEVAYRSMLLLRICVALIEYPSSKIPAWEVPELSGMELEYCRPTNVWRHHAQMPATKFTDSMRVPLRMAYLLRESIVSQEERLTTPLAPIQENKLLGSVDSFLSGYYGMRKFMSTPVPFPLIQMTRTILLFYLYTIPFVLLDDSNQLVEHCAVVFLLTYGFMGLELISIELDDPFGDDANDFDCLAFANMVFEDTYLMIHDADGEEWADSLRYKMHDNAKDPITDELSALLPGGSF